MVDLSRGSKRNLTRNRACTLSFVPCRANHRSSLQVSSYYGCLICCHIFFSLDITRCCLPLFLRRGGLLPKNYRWSRHCFWAASSPSALQPYHESLGCQVSLRHKVREHDDGSRNE